MISLRDISTICGCSVSTVSRALRDYSDISVDTKHYIQSVADQIGYDYRRNQSDRKNANKKSSRCIGLVYRGMKRDETVLGMDIQTLRAVREKAAEKGYDVMLIRGGEEDKDSLSWLACARFHSLEGVIILGISLEMYGTDTMDLAASEIPAVIVGQSYEGSSCINIDFASGMDYLMREVYGHGYRRIAFICPKFDRSAAVRKTVFLRNVMRSGFVSRPEHLVMSDRCSYEEIVFRTKELVHSRSCPECIMYPDDISALWGIEALREEGIRVPEDIGITGFGGASRFFGLGTTLTTWHIDCQKIGDIAAENLFEQIERPDLFLPGTQYIQGTVSAGMTIRHLKRECAVLG